MSGPRPVRELVEVWLRGLPQHEAHSLTELSIAIRFAMVKAQELPPSINSKCRDMINTRLEESEHWMLAALRAAVDRNDHARAEEGRAAPSRPAAPVPPESDYWNSGPPAEPDCGDADERGADGKRNADRA
jgi:hypothetical protein